VVVEQVIHLVLIHNSPHLQQQLAVVVVVKVLLLLLTLMVLMVVQVVEMASILKVEHQKLEQVLLDKATMVVQEHSQLTLLLAQAVAVLVVLVQVIQVLLLILYKQVEQV
jgi:hypothetical protein